MITCTFTTVKGIRYHGKAFELVEHARSYARRKLPKNSTDIATLTENGILLETIHAL